MTETKEQILERMEEIMPFTYSKKIRPYILKAMQIYAEKQLILSDAVSSVFLVQHKETLINYGLFSTREKAEKYINNKTDLFGIQEVKIA